MKKKSSTHDATFKRALRRRRAARTALRAPSLFLGRAGEQWVVAQLLRRGFVAMSMAVDQGVDIVAQRVLNDGTASPYFFQVKTTSRPDSSVRLTAPAFKRLYEHGVNLVAVYWPKGGQPACLVLPPTLLYMMTSGGFKVPYAPIAATRGHINLRIIFRSPQRVFIRNLHHDFSPMLDRFDRIEEPQPDVSHIPPYAEWSERKGALIDFRDDDQGTTGDQLNFTDSPRSRRPGLP